MDVLTAAEMEAIINKSALVRKYNKAIDSQSAYEMLTAKMQEAAKEEAQQEEEKMPKTKGGKEEKGFFENLMDSTITRQIGRTGWVWRLV